MREKLFAPLEMTDSGFAVEEFPDRHAIPYTRIDSQNVEIPLWSGRGFMMHTTASDMARFLIALNNEGRYFGHQLLRPETISRMRDRTTKFKVLFRSSDDLPRRGHGLGMFAFRGGWFGNGGSAPGYQCLMRYNPGRKTGYVISKHPHKSVSPEEFADAFPTHRAVYLIRNPLHRLNSLVRRQWLDAIAPGYDLDRFVAVMERWKAKPGRLLFDDIRRRPFVFFHTIFDAWGWDFDESHVREAVAYTHRKYHDSSKVLSEEHDPGAVFSEGEFVLPRAAIDAYLSRKDVAEFMQGLGWPTEPGAYGDGSAEDIIAAHHAEKRAAQV